MQPRLKQHRINRLNSQKKGGRNYAEILMSDPKAAIEQMGGFIPGDIDLKVVRDTDRLAHVHLPAAPTEREVSETDLMGIQGGTTPICFTPDRIGLGTC